MTARFARRRLLLGIPLGAVIALGLAIHSGAKTEGFFEALEEAPGRPRLACFEIADLVAATEPLDMAEADRLLGLGRCGIAPDGLGSVVETMPGYERVSVKAAGQTRKLWRRA